MTVSTTVLISGQTAYDIARRMKNKKPRPLSAKVWRSFLLSEHSPIRVATYSIRLEQIPYWVSVHFSRHKLGVEHIVTSRRADITGEERSPDDLVNHEMIANAQALISMARKRLCFKAAKETQAAMEAIRNTLALVDTELAIVLSPDCLYRGACREFDSCGLFKQTQHDSNN